MACEEKWGDLEENSGLCVTVAELLTCQPHSGSAPALSNTSEVGVL